MITDTVSTNQPMDQSAIEQTNYLINYTLHLADNVSIIGHKCGEWCGHGPILEQDIAISNVALDYIGQARMLYQYAAEIINETTNQQNNFLANQPATEDSLAYLRDATEFKNLLLTELPNGDWANTVLRLFFFSSYQYFLYQQLQFCTNERLAAIASKAIKEVAYHVRWSADWVIRLGDGTDESKRRIEQAIENLWPYTGELLEPINDRLGFVDATIIKAEWHKKVATIFEEAILLMPQNSWMQSGGFKGNHTEHLGFILAEMQFLQRAYPNSNW